jgi:streptogramin lyase
MSNGIITTIAGTGTAGYLATQDGRLATAAQLNYPFGLAVDSDGNVYIAEYYSHVIRKIDKNGIISTIAGNGVAGFSGDGGLANQATLFGPRGVAVDSNGNIYIADTDNNKIRKINASDGIISTIAKELNGPNGIAVDSLNNVYIAEYYSNVIRKIDKNGNITTIAGTLNTSGFSGDGGTATSAKLSGPSGIAVDSNGNIYIADTSNQRIRKIDAKGIITTIAGNGVAGFSGDGGTATSALLNNPIGLAVDSLNNVYIAEYYSNVIRKIDAKGIISTIAGNGGGGFLGDGGTATSALLSKPRGIAVDSNGNIYIVDTFNQRIRKITYPIPTTMPNTTQPNTTSAPTTLPRFIITATPSATTQAPTTSPPFIITSTPSATTQAPTTLPPFIITATPSATTQAPTTSPPFIITATPSATTQAPTTLPPFTISATPSATTQAPPFTMTATPSATPEPIELPTTRPATVDSISYLRDYITKKDTNRQNAIKTLLDKRVDDSKELVMVQNNTLLLGTMALAILTIGGIIVFDNQ